LAAAVFIASLALLVAAAGARSQAPSFKGSVWVGIKGWGGVRATGGAVGRPTANCADASCRRVNFLLHRPRVVLTAKPYKGWKFARWGRACKSAKKPRCVLDASHGRKDIFGGRSIRAAATFVPVGVGLTRAHPIPLGTAANIIGGFVVGVESANADVQLGTSPPAGTEYFDANLTVTNTGRHLQNLSLIWGGPHAAGSHESCGHRRHGLQCQSYDTDNGAGCPDPGPQPPLDTVDPFNPGESRTGYVCWTIATNDASSLELFFGTGTLDSPRTTWFALR
jgi:hypothetical protein